ncbi:hypothetical protein [Mesobacillus jeotgali]|uniref:HNH endonuclease n=1 Tax=Mesobacillus jeotgali TaxID=129985 RepID=A0ABY9VED6_9BACI|nr:hypothetical protein [Mesobacillus jeotgali]WNF21307.1 hypothetical protein RH061_13995 [Mesobacillus jeotgali]
MSLFTKDLLRYYGATIGAYSPVTKREATGDKSVTLDSHEKNVIFSVYNPTSFARRGGATSVISPQKDFIVHYPDNTTTRVSLPVVYPKKQGNELRLYFNRGVFEANPDDIWFIFVKPEDDIPHIGSMRPEEWAERSIHIDPESIVFKKQLNLDDEDDIFQQEIGAAAVKLPRTSSSLKYPRDPKVALTALMKEEFQCEGNPEHETFESASGKPYMEAHHLIPISLQSKFDASLDVVENIACLCPGDHRLIHYGIGEQKVELLYKLWNRKKEGLKRRGIVIGYEEFLSIYIQSKPNSN